METDRPDKPSADWEAMADSWETVNDLVEGAQAVRDGGERYLPQFPNESDKDYDFRRSTAKYTNVYRDVVEGLASKPFSKEVAVGEDLPPSFDPLIEDIDGRGNHLHVFASVTFFSGINKAIDWILVDYTRSEEELRTVEDEARAGVRPFWVHIPAEKVIWIDSDVIEGREQLTLVRIEETKSRIREYIREGDRVTWNIWEETNARDNSGHSLVWEITASGEITIGVIPMVPFITGRRKGKKWQFYPPMRDAADLQVELYQQETALKYAKTMAAFPMLAGNGVEPDRDGAGRPQQVPVGPQTVLYAPPNNDGVHGEWSWISPDASLLQFLANDIDSTIKELREIGRQPLTAQSGNLTVITTAFAAAKGNSAVQAWALELKDALENALRLTAMWMNETVEPEVKIHTDFGVDDMDGESLDVLLRMRKLDEEGEPDISQKTLWEEFKRRGVLSAEFDPDLELERLLDEMPGGEVLPDESAL